MMTLFKTKLRNIELIRSLQRQARIKTLELLTFSDKALHIINRKRIRFERMV